MKIVSVAIVSPNIVTSVLVLAEDEADAVLQASEYAKNVFPCETQFRFATSVAEIGKPFTVNNRKYTIKLTENN